MKVERREQSSEENTFDECHEWGSGQSGRIEQRSHPALDG